MVLRTFNNELIEPIEPKSMLDCSVNNANKIIKRFIILPTVTMLYLSFKYVSADRHLCSRRQFKNKLKINF